MYKILLQFNLMILKFKENELLKYQKFSKIIFDANVPFKIIGCDRGTDFSKTNLDFNSTIKVF